MQRAGFHGAGLKEKTARSESAPDGSAYAQLGTL
jgi:hypothetical protein